MKKFLLLGLLFIVFIFVFITIPAKADSGWDSSYDSGGSSSSSSWSSSDHDYGSSSSGGSSGNNELTLGEAIFMEAFISIHYLVFAIAPIVNCIVGEKGRKITIIILMLIRMVFLICADIFISPYIAIFDFVFLFALAPISLIFTNKNNSKPSKMYTSFYDVDARELLNCGIDDLDNLKDELYHKFIAIQEAWMHFDYDKLRILCTDELYNTYKSQLEVLKLKNGQNIMSDFTLESIKVYDIKKEKYNVVVDVYMCVSFFDYVIDTTKNKVTRGNKRKKLTNNYTMTFVKSSSDSNNLVHCPNCNSEVYVNASGECEYCGSIIVKNAGEFVLSKKKNINR